jgi:hypothetical protein
MGAKTIPIYPEMDVRKQLERRRFLDVSFFIPNLAVGTPLSPWAHMYHDLFHDSWPQFVDDLLEDIGVRAMRSGGNWLSWPFKVINVDEISTLKAERDHINRRRENYA